MMLIAGLAALPASAVTCYGSAEKNTFIRRTGSSLWGNYGVRGNLYIRNNNLGQCDQQLKFWSTVHLRGPDTHSWVEIGWRHQFFPPDIENWRGFVEWGVNDSESRAYQEFGADCSSSSYLSYSHYGSFKLFWCCSFLPSWYLQYDDNLDGVYCDVAQFTNVTFQLGMSTGETGILGGSDTSAFDHLRLMSYTLSPNDQGWGYFTDNRWYQNCIPGVGHQRLTGNEWQIAAGYPCPS